MGSALSALARVGPPARPRRFRAWLAACAWLVACGPAAAADCLRLQDDFYVIDVRGLGSSFCQEFDWQRLRCRRLALLEGEDCRRWISVPIEDFYGADDPATLTLVYVHGNRVEPGEDIPRGLAVYRALLRCAPDAPPVRFVVFSWPTERVRGLAQDYKVKAQRADPAGLHLAWLLSRLRSDVPVALVGYSYGARVIGGAAHLLAGGSLCGYSLPEQASLATVRVLLIASAVHNDWLLPGRPHGRAMQIVDKLVLINNQSDLALRLYHVSSQVGRPTALGRFGVANLHALGEARSRVLQYDAGHEVGKLHEEAYYLRAIFTLRRAAQHILQLHSDPPPPP